MPSDDVLVRLRGVSKNYRSLRPLRIAELDLHEGRSLALVGFDKAMAEVLVDLITGAILPDSGDVIAFGRPTSAIADPQTWLTALDEFGLLTDRAVLVEQFTVEQNLTIPLSLAVEDIAADLRARVAELAREVGLEPHLQTPAGLLSPSMQTRIRLGRAIATAPRVVVAEHPNATLEGDDLTAFASDYARIVERRGLTSLVLTADRDFARAIATDVLELEPASGTLRALTGWRRWLF
jgi:ABC-type transporter Mla maintaining outer membrane lipid asymmetry ATPase subunit MlaF